MSFRFALALIGAVTIVACGGGNQPTERPGPKSPIKLIFPPPYSEISLENPINEILIDVGKQASSVEINGETLVPSEFQTLWKGGNVNFSRANQLNVNVTYDDDSTGQKVIDLFQSESIPQLGDDLQYIEYDGGTRSLFFTGVNDNNIYHYDIASGTRQIVHTVSSQHNFYHQNISYYGIPIEHDPENNRIYVTESAPSGNASAGLSQTDFSIHQIDLENNYAATEIAKFDEEELKLTQVKHLELDANRNLLYIFDNAGYLSPIRSVDIQNGRKNRYTGWFDDYVAAMYFNFNSHGVIDGDIGYGNGFRYDPITDRFILLSAQTPTIGHALFNQGEASPGFLMANNREVMTEPERSTIDHYVLFNFKQREQNPVQSDNSTELAICLNKAGNKVYVLRGTQIVSVNLENPEDFQLISEFGARGNGTPISANIFSDIEIDPAYPVLYFSSVEGIYAVNLINGDRALLGLKN